ncbi:MAG: phosphatase PAP2 family protein [Spirochaetaceae bacterium]|jgi:membrane-associated phospholipid phosphatase|nr:phosphatase PAP2 family protein [Spirochaetaceae bacterium]
MDTDIIISAGDPERIPEVYRWGIDLIRGIQTIESPGLTAVMRVVTEAVWAYVLVTLFILWCVDERKGLRLGIILILSAWINGTLKLLLRRPRPYQLDPSVGRGFEGSYGMPSGHAQMSLVFWVPLGIWVNKRIGRAGTWIGVILLVLVISFTRLYLGLHFPADLLGGWLLGGLILGIYVIFGPSLERLLAAGGTRPRMISSALAAFLMNTLYPGDVRFGALLLGFGAGYSLMLERFPVSARGMIRGNPPGAIRLLARYVLGLAGIGALYWGSRSLFGGSLLPGNYYRLGRFIQYGLLGFWASAGAPWLFSRLGLAEKKDIPLS